MNQREQKRALILDSSVNFGGAIVSLSEFSPHISNFTLKIASCQETATIESLFHNQDVVQVRPWLNYSHRFRLNHWLNRNLSSEALGRAVKRAFVALDRISEIRQARILGQIIQAFRPNILHLNNVIEPIGLRLGLRYRVPVVAHLRQHIDGPHWTEAQKAGTSMLAKVICISPYVMSSAIAAGIPKDLLHEIPISCQVPTDAEIDRQRTEFRSEHGLGNDEFVVSILGRICPLKGQRLLVDAFLGWLNEGNTGTLLIAGDSSDLPDEYERELHLHIDQARVFEKIRLLGYLRDVSGLLAASDVVVLATTGPEGFGRVVIEGMAYGAAVISTRCGGPEAAVLHGKTGLLVDQGDSRALQSAIARLHKDASLRGELVRNARKLVYDRYRSEKVARDIEDVYDTAIQSVVQN